MQLYGIIWYSIVLYGNTWYFMILYGKLGFCIILDYFEVLNATVHYSSVGVFIEALAPATYICWSEIL